MRWRLLLCGMFDVVVVVVVVVVFSDDFAVPSVIPNRFPRSAIDGRWPTERRGTICMFRLSFTAKAALTGLWSELVKLSIDSYSKG
jgi:hypothetical protein